MNDIIQHNTKFYSHYAHFNVCMIIKVLILFFPEVVLTNVILNANKLIVMIIYSFIIKKIT